jgi:hypothetical protein
MIDTGVFNQAKAGSAQGRFTLFNTHGLIAPIGSSQNTNFSRDITLVSR